MRSFIKNSYLFLIFFIILLSKYFIFSIFSNEQKIVYQDEYVNYLEKEVEDIKLIKKTKLKNNFEYGKVLYQNPYHFKKDLTVIMDTENVNINDYVLDKDSLIGIVSKVYEDYVIVKLITDDNFKMQVKINDCYGVLNTNENIYVKGINDSCKVKEGTKVYTSNLGKYNESFLIGNVSKIVNKKDYKVYYLNLNNNLNYLNYVIILTGVK